MRSHLTIVGAGMGGLVAAVAAREAGFDVSVHEARKEVGGRARTAAGDRRANWGPHVVYGDGPLWAWLQERGLGQPAARAPLAVRFAFRVDGRARLLPPPRTLKGVLRLAKSDAPVEASFRDWACETLGDPVTASQVANFMGVNTFDHDPGRLSAAFVNERLRRGLKFPPQVRYVRGGWQMLADRLAERRGRWASRSPRAAQSTRCRRHRPSWPYRWRRPRICWATRHSSGRAHAPRSSTWACGAAAATRSWCRISDASGWVETFSRADRSLAPPGEQLVQAQAGLRPGETLDQGVERIEALLDLGYPRWRERETWRRRMAVEGESGALDLPGTTWRDRPQGDRGDGIHIVGDMVAAPGVLSEVSHRSALDAVASLSAESGLRRVA